MRRNAPARNCAKNIQITRAADIVAVWIGLIVERGRSFGIPRLAARADREVKPLLRQNDLGW
jgi:hypothetical protein